MLGWRSLAKALRLGDQVVVVGTSTATLRISSSSLPSSRTSSASLDEPLPRRLTTVKPPSSDRPCDGDAGVDGGFGVGRGELVFDPFELIDEACNGVVAGMSTSGLVANVHQFLLVGAAAVQHVGQAQALADAQLLVQLQRRLQGAGR
jgi:hypothetical protein